MVSLMPDDLPRWIGFQWDARFALFSVLVTGAAAMLFGSGAGRCRPRRWIAVAASGGVALFALPGPAPPAGCARGGRGRPGVHVAGVFRPADPGLPESPARRSRVPAGPSDDLAARSSGSQVSQGGAATGGLSRAGCRLKALPGVAGISAASHIPLGGHEGNFFLAEGAPPPKPNQQYPVF